MTTRRGFLKGLLGAPAALAVSRTAEETVVMREPVITAHHTDTRTYAIRPEYYANVCQYGGFPYNGGSEG